MPTKINATDEGKLNPFVTNSKPIFNLRKTSLLKNRKTRILPNVANLYISCPGDLQLSFKIKEVIQSTKCTKLSSFLWGVLISAPPHFSKTEKCHPRFFFL